MTESDRLMEEILGNGPSQGTFRILLTRLQEDSRWTLLIQHCLRALAFYPEDLYLRSLLAEAYFQSGRIGQAETELDELLSRMAPLVSSYKLQAKVYLRQNRRDDASYALHRYLAHRPEDQEALDLLARIPSGGETVEPERPEASEQAGDSAVAESVLPILAERHYSQGRIKEAIETYERVVSQSPDETGFQGRIDVLKALAAQTDAEERSRQAVRGRQQKMIGVLEGWLAKIQETDRAG
jgi:tetratricopeptide (TPR) repeat protein